ncbi:histidinol-phosphate transaminase [Hyphococcus flavus]|uniref:histidinol-phosphate transaminase n=1 Tax=Hyphococcus flavus TaxID=1866326 RepID=A0AAF0CHW5_9PROT|nr:histidinol-phosphate transaminase [Hyphococcus flavus]WDI32322.1 histidinol-phosphate transaminase [Hyphococcus flavus]
MTAVFNRRLFLAGSAAATSLAMPPSVMARIGPTPENPIRLMYNENPYGPGPKARAAAAKELQNTSALYPESSHLRNKLADYHGLTPAHVALSSGSTEMLHAAASVFGRSGTVIGPTPTYGPQFDYARAKGVDVILTPLNDEFANDLDALAARTGSGAGMVYICNPNNPTGVLVDAGRLRDFCDTVGRDAVVVVDEAYNDLVDQPVENSMIDLVTAEKNVIVVKTFSKIYGLAGLRIGYALGRPDLIEALQSEVMTWISRPGLAAAMASLDDKDFYNFSKKKIIEGREKIYAACDAAGFDYVKSQTNFVFVNVKRNADAFAADMLARGVNVRGAVYPPYTTYSRVSTGKLEEVDYFAGVLKSIAN